MSVAFEQQVALSVYSCVERCYSLWFKCQKCTRSTYGGSCVFVLLQSANCCHSQNSNRLSFLSFSFFFFSFFSLAHFRAHRLLHLGPVAIPFVSFSLTPTAKQSSRASCSPLVSNPDRMLSISISVLLFLFLPPSVCLHLSS